MDTQTELITLLQNPNCDYDRCRRLIREIGGCTKIIEGAIGGKTTALHEAVSGGHYIFAMELILEPGTNLDVDPDEQGCIIWELQYIDAETDDDRLAESEHKLRLVRALINAGANPNPVQDGESLLNYLRYKIGDGDSDWYHLFVMEHIIDAHINNQTEQFFDKLKERRVCRIMLPKLEFLPIDDNLCDCESAVFIFDDGTRMYLSCYQKSDDEWDFYAGIIREELKLGDDKHFMILPQSGYIEFLSLYSDEEISTSHWLDLSIDDAILRLHPSDQILMVGVVGYEMDDYTHLKRKTLLEV